MDDFEEENTVGGELKCYIQTDPPTKRVLEEHSLLETENLVHIKQKS